MEQRAPDIFITKLREKTDRNGNRYFIGNLGMMTITLWPHKTNQGEWNMKGRQAEERKAQTQAPEFSDEIPF